MGKCKYALELENKLQELINLTHNPNSRLVKIGKKRIDMHIAKCGECNE